MAIKLISGVRRQQTPNEINPVAQAGSFLQPPLSNPQQNPQDVTTGQDIAQAALGAIPSVARGAIGSVGDLLSFLEKVPYRAGFGLANIVSGGAVPTYGDIEKKYGLEGQPAAPFTTESLPQPIKPIGPISRFATEVAEDIGGFIPWLIGGGLNPSQALKQVARFGRAAAGGTAASRIAELYDVRPETAQLIKMGTTLGLAPIGQAKEAKEFASNAFKQTKDLAKDVNVKIPNTQNALKKVKTNLKGRSFEDVDKVRGFVDDALENFKGGKADLQKLVQLHKDANSRFPKLSSLAREELKDIKKIIADGILENPFSQNNKAFSDAFKQSNEIWSALSNANLIDNFSQRLIAKKLGPELLLTGIGSYISNLLGIPKAAGASLLPATVITATEASRVAKFLKESTTGRRLYAEVMKNVFNSQIPDFEKNMKKLNEQYNKFESPTKQTGSSKIKLISGKRILH
jgi:hypothetical protein